VDFFDNTSRLIGSGWFDRRTAGPGFCQFCRFLAGLMIGRNLVEATPSFLTRRVRLLPRSLPCYYRANAEAGLRRGIVGPGPYEFTLTRVVIPARSPYNPPHYRSGAALYYIVSGTGARIVNGRTESWPPGSSVYEPYGLVHQWANPGDAPFTILQANISSEGAPVVIMGTPPASK
jgi:quercetin dioxygenase-like cupin family protein